MDPFNINGLIICIDGKYPAVDIIYVGKSLIIHDEYVHMHI